MKNRAIFTGMFVTGFVVFIITLMNYGYVKAEEISDQATSTTPSLTVSDVEAAIDNYFYNQREQEYNNLFVLPEEGMRPRASVEMFFNKTEAERFDFLLGQLQGLSNKIDTLSRSCLN